MSNKQLNCETEAVAARRCAGFTLMEVAIAILVMAVGVVSVFSLMSSGLDSSAKALFDTQAGLFADGVFRGLRARTMAVVAGEDFGDVEGHKYDTFSTFWGDFKSGATSIRVPALPVWKGKSYKISSRWGETSMSEYPVVFGSGASSADVFRPEFKIKSLHGVTYTDETRLEDHVMRYKLGVELKTNPDRAEVTLLVWEGQFGPTDVNDALVFYTEFNDPGVVKPPEK